MSKYKSQRPPERWESNKGMVEKKVQEIAVRPQYAKPIVLKQPKVGARNIEPPVMFNDGNAHMYGPSPTDTSIIPQQEAPQQEQPPPLQREKSEGAQNPKRLNAMTSDAASAALRRALQSSPARWNGSRQSPIEVDVDKVDTTRRLLFPSPRKDGSPKVLGETITNIVQISPLSKEHMVNVPNKENCPPITVTENEDDEFLRLFEEEMDRPTTPVQKEAPPNPFKTPTRPTPSHRPITRSVSKSAKKSPSQFLAVTPSRITPRRSPRNHNNAFVSPFTATLNQMMSEASNHAQTSPSRGGMNFDLDALPDLHVNMRSMDGAFNLEDFFSTDAPMPSSPPRSFRMYEDPMAHMDMDINNIDWSEFQDYSEIDVTGGAQVDDGDKNTVIKEEAAKSPVKEQEKKTAEDKSA